MRSMDVRYGCCATPERARDIVFSKNDAGALQVECVCVTSAGDCCLRSPTPAEQERWDMLVGKTVA